LYNRVKRISNLKELVGVNCLTNERYFLRVEGSSKIILCQNESDSEMFFSISARAS